MIKTQEEYNKEFKEVQQKMFELFNDKNVRYDSSYFKHDNWLYDFTRKYHRLEALEKKFDQKDFEENMMDIGVYAVMALMKMKKGV